MGVDPVRRGVKHWSGGVGRFSGAGSVRSLFVNETSRETRSFGVFPVRESQRDSATKPMVAPPKRYHGVYATTPLALRRGNREWTWMGWA